MSKLSTIVFAIAAAFAAGPALADAPQGEVGVSADAAAPAKPQRTKRLGTRLEVVVVHGAVDPKKERWTDSGKSTPVLPTISESAFLEADDAGIERSADSTL